MPEPDGPETPAVRELFSINLVLVRHAQARNLPGTDYDDASLSPTGRARPGRPAVPVAARRPDALYTSPAARAAETATGIGAEAGLDAIPDERLREYRFGSIGTDGLTIAQLRERNDHLRIWQPHPGSRITGWQRTANRCTSSPTALRPRSMKSQPGTSAVTHAGSIDAALRWAIGMTPDAPWMHSFPTSNASITELTLWPQGRMRGGAPRYADFASMGSVLHLRHDLYSDY